MADPETDVAPATTDPAFTSLMNAIVEVMRSASRPDVLEAQRLLLQRLATQGDIFPSRIPPPRNITEVGGYLNLLELAGEPGMRMSAVASALGVAGPPTGLDELAGAVPVGFIEVSNDRPAGTIQPSIPPLLTIRADFHAPLQSAKQALHGAGCLLPLRAPRASLPTTQPGATASSLDMDAVLAVLGRTLEIVPGTVLADPTVDALAIARPETPATDPFRLVARELDGGTRVNEASWVVKRASSGAVVDDPPAPARYADVAPVMQAAGWIHPEPVELPASLRTRGTLVRFVNVTGLVADETTLGAELTLLYTPAAIARSALAPFTAWLWQGTTFGAPA